MTTDQVLPLVPLSVIAFSSAVTCIRDGRRKAKEGIRRTSDLAVQSLQRQSEVSGDLPLERLAVELLERGFRVVESCDSTMLVVVATTMTESLRK